MVLGSNPLDDSGIEPYNYCRGVCGIETPDPKEVAGEMGSNLHDVVRPHLLTKRGSNLAHVGPYSTYRFTGIEP